MEAIASFGLPEICVKTWYKNRWGSAFEVFNYLITYKRCIINELMTSDNEDLTEFYENEFYQALLQITTDFLRDTNKLLL